MRLVVHVRNSRATKLATRTQVYEILDNAIDEVQAGHASDVTVCTSLCTASHLAVSVSSFQVPIALPEQLWNVLGRTGPRGRLGADIGQRPRHSN